jgi:predicted nucleotidyltransferase
MRFFVLTVARPARIILFGSAASGQITEDSYIDLLAYPAQKYGRVLYGAA